MEGADADSMIGIESPDVSMAKATHLRTEGHGAIKLGATLMSITAIDGQWRHRRSRARFTIELL